jgi:hypothetical protein
MNSLLVLTSEQDDVIRLLIRVTTKFNKNLPNIWKCGQNCSQYMMAQIEIPKPLHTTAFNVKISTSNHVLKQLQLKM